MEFSKEKDVVEVSPTEEVVLYDDVKVKFNSVSGRNLGEGGILNIGRTFSDLRTEIFSSHIIRYMGASSSLTTVNWSICTIRSYLLRHDYMRPTDRGMRHRWGFHKIYI